jgi:hypothetical protein
METFQKIILMIAVIILIITLVFIGIVLSYSKNNNKWPPVVPECPDYWIMDLSNNCINTKGLGTCPPQSGQQHLVMNFNTATYKGSNGLCAKYKWAQNCKVAWDGVTYGVNNPCTTSS